MKVVFFGSSRFVIPIIGVLKKNFDLALVLTTERLASQGETLQPPVIKYCIKNKINYRSISNLFDQNLKSYILNLKSPVAVLADFGLIIPKDILNLFPHGIINIHPSLLPKYRGPTPVQAAILNGDKTTGVTIIRLDEEVDHGPILFQTKENILPNDTSESLYDRLFKLGASSIVSTIELYINGKIKPKEQDHSKATFTKKLAREDGYFDFNNPPPKELFNRMIRAYNPWPSVWSKWKMKNGKWKIVKFLPSEKVQVEGKKPMSYKDFINGYPKVGREILTKLNLY